MSKTRMDKITQDLCQKYELDYKGDLWLLSRGDNSVWIIKNSALERIASANEIKFDKPEIIESSITEGYVVLLITGSMGERTISTFGSATKATCKVPYLYEMAEKRAKGRVILKLLSLYGDVYSEDEASTFEKNSTYSKIIANNDDDEIKRIRDVLLTITDRKVLVEMYKITSSPDIRELITQRGLDIAGIKSEDTHFIEGPKVAV